MVKVEQIIQTCCPSETIRECTGMSLQMVPVPSLMMVSGFMYLPDLPVLQIHVGQHVQFIQYDIYVVWPYAC